MPHGYHIKTDESGYDYYFQKGRATFMIKFYDVISCKNGILILEEKVNGSRWHFKNGICIHAGEPNKRIQK